VTRREGLKSRRAVTAPVAPPTREHDRESGSRLGPALRLVRPDPGRGGGRSQANSARHSLALLLGSTVFLTIGGLIMVLSAGSISAAQGYNGNSFWYFNRQVLFAVAGFAVLVLMLRLPYRAWRRLSLPLLVVILPLMVIALHPASGTALYGASRWIDLGFTTLQPSELMKPALVAFTATVLASKWNKLDDPVHLLIPLAPVVLLVAVLVLLQKDLGTTAILCSSVFVLLFVAGVRFRYLFWTAAAGLGASAYLIFGVDYRRTRLLDSWLNSRADPHGAGFQLIQGLIALASGGWFGVGLGNSRQKWDYLPNAHSDFIFAVIGEELGLLGAIVVLVAFGVLLCAGIRIAVQAPDAFGRLLATGITAWIGLQTIVNLGAVTGLLPITGVPLPLVSFGGSALVVTLAGIGVLGSVARGSISPVRRARTASRGTRARSVARPER
jgi:cell division protein FtsW